VLKVSTKTHIREAEFERSLQESQLQIISQIHYTIMLGIGVASSSDDPEFHE